MLRRQVTPTSADREERHGEEHDVVERGDGRARQERRAGDRRAGHDSLRFVRMTAPRMAPSSRKDVDLEGQQASG